MRFTGASEYDISSKVELSPLRPGRAGGQARAQLRDEVMAHVRESIIAGRLRPGERIRIAALAAETDASMTPVREALLSLAQDSWVILEPNRGFRVAAIRRRDIEDSYVVHAFVAGEIAARAAREIGDRELDALARLHVELRTSDSDGHRLIEELNYRFHHVIYDVADAPRLEWYIEAASRFVPRRFWATIPGWLDMCLADHERILEAMLRRDAEASRTAMAEHITRAGALLIGNLDRAGFWSEGAEE